MTSLTTLQSPISRYATDYWFLVFLERIYLTKSTIPDIANTKNDGMVISIVIQIDAPKASQLKRPAVADTVVYSAYAALVTAMTRATLVMMDNFCNAFML